MCTCSYMYTVPPIMYGMGYFLTLSLEIGLDENHDQSLSCLLYMKLVTVLSSCDEIAFEYCSTG